MSTPEENKQVVREFWKGALTGDTEGMLSLLTDDARLQTIGDMPICGQRNKAEFVEAMIEMSQNFDGAGAVRLGEIIAERDIVVAEADSYYKTKEGQIYNNQYVYVYYIKDGKIVGMKEHADTLHTFERLPNRLTRGPRIDRMTNIWKVDSELEGDCGSVPDVVPAMPVPEADAYLTDRGELGEPDVNDLTFDDGAGEKLVQRAAELRPLLQRNAPLNEAQGYLTEEVVDALIDAEVWKMAAPKRWGGLCLPANAMARVTHELAQGCPSTGWVVGVMNSALWIASVMPDAMQEAVFADGVPRFCSVSAPPGSAVPTDGGYIVNGQWNYASGCHHSDYAFVGVVLTETSGSALGAAAMIPMSELEIVNTWHVAGMKGTGSDAIKATDVFVPEHMFNALQQFLGVHEDGKKHVGEPSDFWPALPLLKSKALGVIIGSAQGLLDSVGIPTKDKPIHFTTYTQRVDSNVFQASIGKARARIDAARVLMNHATSEIDKAALTRDPLSLTERVRNRGETSIAVDLAVEASRDLMDQAGSSAFLSSNNAQRYWRDLNVGARHVQLLPWIGFEIAGQELLGVEPNTPFDFL